MAKTLEKKYNKTQILDAIAESSGLSRKDVGNVIEALGGVIEDHIGKGSVGEFVLPGMLKIVTVNKPAVPEREGINPFTKEKMIFKAKPASTAVRVRPLKKLKEMAQ